MSKSLLLMFLSRAPVALILSLTLFAGLAGSVHAQFFVANGADTKPRDAFRLAFSKAPAPEQGFDSYPNTMKLSHFKAGACRVDIHGIAQGDYAADHGVIFSSQGYFNKLGIFWKQGLMSAAQGASGWVRAPIMEFSFCPPVEGFGAWVFDDAFDSKFRLTVTEVDGKVLHSPFIDSGAILHPVLEGFLGYVSKTGVERVVIEQQTLTGAASTDPFQVDYVQVGQPMYTALSHSYGRGWAATGRTIPTLSVSAKPALGTLIQIQMGNPSGVATTGVLGIGAAPAYFPQRYSGNVYVEIHTYAVLSVPAGGLSIPIGLAQDPALHGACFFLQSFVPDTGSIGFSPGLKLVLD